MTRPEDDGSAAERGSALPAPVEPAGSEPGLAALARQARGYAEAASAAETRRAYAADWRQFASWCRREGLDPLAGLAAAEGGAARGSAGRDEAGSADHGRAMAERSGAGGSIIAMARGAGDSAAGGPGPKGSAESESSDVASGGPGTAPNGFRPSTGRPSAGSKADLTDRQIGHWIDHLPGRPAGHTTDGPGNRPPPGLSDARQGETRPADPRLVGLYLAACAAGTPAASGRPLTVATIERRLSGLVRAYALRGLRLDRRDRHIAEVLAGIRRTHAAPPRQKAAIGPGELIAMLDTCDRGQLAGLRDRAMLLLGFAGGLRRSEITGLDLGRDQTADGRGWIEVMTGGILVTLRGKTGWREVEIGHGSAPATCPVAALETWLATARIAEGPLFRRILRGVPGPMRLNDREVARLVKRAALAAGLRPDLPEAARAALFAGHSLRAGLASSAEVEERHVQKQLGHASAEMTRRYQRRRDRFRVNLTKAAGL